MSDKPNYETTWQEEANAVMQDVKRHVHRIFLSSLPSSKTIIFFNLTTLEMKDFCVELTREGFRVVGEHHDSDAKRGKYPAFETPYSMLDNLSPAYRDSFRDSLLLKLSQLQKEREEEERAEAQAGGRQEEERKQEEMGEKEDPKS